MTASKMHHHTQDEYIKDRTIKTVGEKTVLKQTLWFPTPGSVQWQARWDFEQPGLWKVALPVAGGLEIDDL